jgi:hypothetical protein
MGVSEVWRAEGFFPGVEIVVLARFWDVSNFVIISWFPMSESKKVIFQSKMFGASLKLSPKYVRQIGSISVWVVFRKYFTTAGPVLTPTRKSRTDAHTLIRTQLLRRPRVRRLASITRLERPWSPLDHTAFQKLHTFFFHKVVQVFFLKCVQDGPAALLFFERAHAASKIEKYAGGYAISADGVLFFGFLVLVRRPGDWWYPPPCE